MVSRNANVWWSLAESAFSGSLESGGRFYVGEFGRNMVTVSMKSYHIQLTSQRIKFILSMRIAKIMQ
jgi:hypothetical protein